jgi:DNA-binding MarR family transcriptional regulator
MRRYVTEGQQLARALRAAYWAMHRRTNAVLAAHGVTADQFVLLSRLADQDAITQQVLARRCNSDANTIRPMLVLLEKQGLVARRAHASDGRARCVALTPEGRRAFRAMMRGTAPLRRRMLAGIKYGNVGELCKNLSQIAQSLEAPARRDPKQPSDGPML